MLTKAIWSVPSLSATAIGTPNSVASGLTMVKLVSGSASRPSALVWRNSVGTPAACSGSQTASATADWLRPTATTPASTIWLAQSVPPAGSAPVSQVTTSIGRPPTPALWVFQYSAVASATRSSSELSNACVAPSDTIPMRTGSPDAGSSGPSRSVASLPDVASSSSDGGIVVVIVAARDGPEQQHAQGGESDRSPGPPAAAPWFFTRLLHLPSPEFWTICPGHLFPLLS